MKKKIINVFLMALLAMVTVGTVVSCKDYEEDNYSDLNGKFANLNEAVEAQAKALEERIKILEEVRIVLEDDIESLRNELGNVTDDKTKTTIYGRLASAEAAISLINEQIGKIEESLAGKADKTALDDLTRRVEELEGCCKSLKETWIPKITANEDAIKALQKLIDADKVKVWEDGISEAKIKADSALTLARADSARLALLIGENGLLGEDGADYKAFRDAVATALQNADGTWKDLDDVLQEQLDMVRGSYDGTLEDIDKAYKAADEALEEKIKKVNARVDSLALVTDELNNKLGMIQNSLNKYVSSVLIQGTDNPVFGSFAFPANISSNVLAAYYGDVKDLKFPTDEPYNYVNAQNALSAKDLEMMGVAAGNQFSYNGRVVSGMKADGRAEDGNAGTLYVTVNPNTVNAVNTTAVLVNSQDARSGVVLSPLAKTDKVLNFGYTRAANNGFYEAKATVQVDAVDEVSPRISYDDLSGLKNEIKDAVNAVRNKGNVDITGLIYSVYSISSNILDAQAVKFPWSDTDIYGNTVERATYSQYALAATAVHPLSFGFAKDVHYDEFPGINKVEDIIGDMFNKIEDAIPTIDVDDLNIHIEIEDFVFDPVELEDGSVVVNVDILDEETGKHYKQTIDITDKVEEAVNEALGSAAGDVSAYIKDVVDQLNEQVAQINDIIDQLRDINEIGNKLDEVEDKIYDYLSKGENLLLKLVNNANELLQPMMLAKTADSYVVLSRSASAPTKFRAASMTTDGIILRPTTYSAEVLAPAFKKFVGVANVYKDGKSAQGGDANCQAALKAANSSSEGFCTVQEGDWNKARFKVSSQYKKGYVYEIVYTAADYSGKIVVKRFYIELV